MGPKPSSDKPKGTSNIVNGVEFIYEDPKLRSQTVKVLKPKGSNTVEIGSQHFGNNSKSMSDKHVQLEFKNSKVLILDLGSRKGTWVESKSGALEKNSSHELKDGDWVVFGVKKDKGDSKPDPEALRIKVRFTKETESKPPSSASANQTLKVPPVLSKRPITPDGNLKPSNGKGHQRTISLQASSKPPSITVQNPKKPENKPPVTTLETHIEIPWSETFRLGFGVNALTGEFVPNSALRHDYKIGRWSNANTAQMVTKRLQWSELKELQDEFEMKAGGTVNVLCPAGANVKIASVLSENSSSSTLLIQCKVHADFEPQYLPVDVDLMEGLEKLTDEEFRDRYGDYYIAGWKKAYTCRMIVACRKVLPINAETVTAAHESEAEALVEGYLKGGIKLADLKKRSEQCSLLNVVVDARGCSIDPNKIFSVTVENAKDELARLIEKAPGVPRVAYLYHYSGLKSCHLSPRLNVLKDMFEKAHTMRQIYSYLQACLLHPAFKTFFWRSRSIHSALTNFEKKRRNLVPIMKDGDNTRDFRTKFDPLYKELNAANEKAYTLIRRFNFINLVKDMNKDIEGREKFSKLQEYKLVSFDSENYKAYELKWESPLTSGTGALLRAFGPPPRQVISFQTKADRAPPLVNTPDPSPSRLHKNPPASVANQEKESATFNYCLENHEPVLILGWSIWCYWPEKRKEPALEVNGSDNCILLDHLELSVDDSVATRWHCTVTFVIKSAHNFPGLL
ncbi:hypothetical protein K435DRAFT_962632 [Dendrothele bispora CBS 962.96]|uniref:FHA domain-containing protein n=1 Tax=Dendrothele bispora (strain CBS 962.96) TaxID=1314807 RepID=A0A4S8MK93_DENBC|nr:hypothetical protein K435DRAFT_962632 [Dendrothele bispora CBS 962.96]